MSDIQEHSYIRGAGAGHVDGQKVLTIVSAAVLVVMLAVTAYLFSSTASANKSAEDLAQSGMAVTATVTGCQGISDGVGMGVEYYNCSAQVSNDASGITSSITSTSHLRIALSRMS